MTLYQPLHPKLSRFVQTLIWDKEDARDIVSETILIAFERFDKIKEEQAFLSYIFSIASNLVKKRIRRNKIWELIKIQKKNELSNGNHSEGRIILYELHLALNKLPTKQYEALVWYEISGISINEIAKHHKISVEGVKTNIHRARKKVAELLEHSNNSYLKGSTVKGIWHEK